jgi:hypothetical protein
MQNVKNPLRRPPLRRRRRTGRSRLEQIVLVLLGLGGTVGAAFLLFGFLSKVVAPYKLGYALSNDLAAKREELDRQLLENKKLSARLSYLKSEEGAERLARRQGYHRPGERVYLLRETPPPVPPRP